MKYINMIKALSNNIIVNASQIIGTEIVIFATYKLINGSPFESNYSTITSWDHWDGYDGWFGRVGTDPDPSEYEDVPVGDKRSHLVHEAYQKRFMHSYDMIHQADQNTRNGIHRDGEVTMNIKDVNLDPADGWVQKVR